MHDRHSLRFRSSRVIRYCILEFLRHPMAVGIAIGVTSSACLANRSTILDSQSSNRQLAASVTESEVRILMTQTPPLNLTLDPISFARDMQRARDAVNKFKARLRPTCPSCKKTCAVVGSRLDGEQRVRYLGCRRCMYRAPGVEVVESHETGHRSSNYARNESGRFMSTR